MTNSNSKRNSKFRDRIRAPGFLVLVWATDTDEVTKGTIAEKAKKPPGAECGSPRVYIGYDTGRIYGLNRNSSCCGRTSYI